MFFDNATYKKQFKEWYSLTSVFILLVTEIALSCKILSLVGLDIVP